MYEANSRDRTVRWRKILLASSISFMATIGAAEAAVVVNSETSVTVSETGDVFRIDYACATDCGGAGDPLYEMTATAVWTVSDIGADYIAFEIEIANTTINQSGDANRITRFGVQSIAPEFGAAEIDNSDSTVAPDWSATTGTNFPAFQTVDLNIFEVGQGDAGLHSLESDTLVLLLSGFDSVLADGGITLDVFPVKFQSLSGTLPGSDSWQFAGTVRVIPGSQFEVTEPSSFLIMSFGLLGFGAALRRRNLTRHLRPTKAGVA